MYLKLEGDPPKRDVMSFWILTGGPPSTMTMISECLAHLGRHVPVSFCLKT